MRAFRQTRFYYDFHIRYPTLSTPFPALLWLGCIFSAIPRSCCICILHFGRLSLFLQWLPRVVLASLVLASWGIRQRSRAYEAGAWRREGWHLRILRLILVGMSMLMIYTN